MICFLGGLDLFKGFLKSEFSEENLEFWIACEEFRLSNDSNMEFLAQKIYGDFVAYQAPKEVLKFVFPLLRTNVNINEHNRKCIWVNQANRRFSGVICIVMF